MIEDSCIHGWTTPPECPQCLTVERDRLSDDLRRNLERIQFLNHRIDRLYEILDEAHQLVIDHHSTFMRGNTCPVCVHPKNNSLITALEQNRKQLNQKRKESAQNV